MGTEAFTRAVFEARSAHAVSIDANGRVLVLSDLTGTFQLYELDPPELDPPDHPDQVPPLRPLTDLPDRVGGRYVPGGRRLVVSADSGGNERAQLYLLDVEADAEPVTQISDLRPLVVDPDHVHGLAGVSPDGRLVAFLSNRRNGIDFDLWVVDIASGEQRCLYDAGGWCQPGSGFSPDGRLVSVIRPGARPLDDDLLLVDVQTAALTVIDPHPEEAAIVGAPAWLDPTRFVVSTSVGRDTRALVRFDLTEGGRHPLVAGEWDVAGWSSADGSTLLAAVNDDGATRGVFVDPWTGERLGQLPLPEDGVMGMASALPRPRLAPDGSSVTYTFTSPTRPADVWCHDRGADTSRRLTVSPATVAPDGLVGPERHHLTSFDGERISVSLYRPSHAPERDSGNAAASLTPAVLRIHGGPESQSMLSYAPLLQAIVASGVAVVVPNVRGSTGYGKRFAALDDTTHRLDSVADLAAVHDWLAGVGLDPARAGLVGTSYGGYMVLAGCTFQPGRWVAGIDEVGMSDLVTFLEHTSPYRRSHRELEYGSLAADREFLASASPLRRVDDLRARLFVIHGTNDPRVPLSEAEQLVASLRRRDIPCELAVYDDEGHGLSRLANKLDAYPRAVAFLAAALGA